MFWEPVDETVLNSIDIKPLKPGRYAIRVRAIGFGGHSRWLTSKQFNIDADPNPLPAPDNLDTTIGSGAFTGTICEIEWDPVAEIAITSDVTVWGSGVTYATWDVVEYSDRFYRSLNDNNIGNQPDTATNWWEICSPISSKLQDYVVGVYNQGGQIGQEIRTEYVKDTRYAYTLEKNIDDHSGTPVRYVDFRVWSRDVYDQISTTPAFLAASNPAPDMSGTTPTVTDIFKALKIDWTNITPNDTDLSYYEIYCDTNATPTTLVGTVSKNTTQWIEPELEPETTYYCKILPYDEFGVGVASNVVDGEPVRLPLLDIDAELTGNILMSDSDSNTEETLAVLYDRVKVSGGVGYTLSGVDKYIEYAYPIQNLIDRVAVWTADANAHIYFAYTEDGTTWSYLKAEADHTLDSDGALLAASNQADAVTNYWQVASGKNVAVFPNGIACRSARLYMTGTYSTTIYELIFERQVIAEQILADTLAAITANLGTIASGLLQSPNLAADDGVLLDLDSEYFKMGGTQVNAAGGYAGVFIGEDSAVYKVYVGDGANQYIKYAPATGVELAGKIIITASGSTIPWSAVTDDDTHKPADDATLGATWGGDISNEPTELSDINSTEATKLTNIEENADVTKDHPYVATSWWSFENTADGFTSAGDITLTPQATNLLAESTGTDPRFTSPSGLTINGAKDFYIRLRIKRLAGSSWQGTIYYSTSGHGFTSGYRKDISAPGTWGSDWHVLEWDMSNLTAGGTDWITNTITQLRFDFGSSATDDFEIDWIAVGHSSVGDKTADQFTESLSDIDSATDRTLLGFDASGNVITKVVPASAVAPTGAGLYLGSDYMGYYDSSNWKTYMANNGDFFLGGSSGALQWDASEDALTILGDVTVTGGKHHSSFSWVANGDFAQDDDAETDPVGWTVTKSGTPPNCRVWETTSVYWPPWEPAAKVYYGNCSIDTQYVSLDSTDYIPVNINKPYTLSAMVRGYSGTRSFYYGLMCYTSAKAACSPTSVYYIAGSNASPATSWTEYSGTIHPYTDTGETHYFPSDCAYVKVRCIVQYQAVGASLVSRLALVEGYVATEWGKMDAGNLIADSITVKQIGTNEIIAYAANIKNAIITGAKIGNLEVDTLQIKGNAVTNPLSAYTAGTISVTTSGVNVQSQAITCTGAPIHVSFACAVRYMASGETLHVRLKRGSTELLAVLYSGNTDEYCVVNFAYSDSPSASTYTYYLHLTSSVGNYTATCRSMLLLEAKK